MLKDLMHASRYRVDGWALPEALVGLWSSMGHLFQAEIDIDTADGLRRFVIWWLEHGQRLYPGLSKEISGSLLLTLHSSDYSNGLTWQCMTPLMRIVYSSRPDLQVQYPDLTENCSASGYWQWWYLYGTSALGLPHNGLPAPLPNDSNFGFQPLARTLKHLANISGEMTYPAVGVGSPDDELLYWWIAAGRLRFHAAAQWLSAWVIQSTHTANYAAFLEGSVPVPSRLMFAVLNYRPDLFRAYGLQQSYDDFWRWWLAYGAADYGLPNCGLPYFGPDFLAPIAICRVIDLDVPVSPPAVLAYFLSSGDANAKAFYCDDTARRDVLPRLEKWLTSPAALGMDQLLPFMLASIWPEMSWPGEVKRPESGALRSDATQDGLSCSAPLFVLEILAAFLGGTEGVREKGGEEWLRSDGAALAPYSASLLLPTLEFDANSAMVPAAAGANHGTSEASSDIQVIGYPSGQFGIGEDARLVYEAARASYGRVRLLQSKRKIGAKELEYPGIEDIGAIAESSCRIFCMPAFDTIALLHDVGERPFSDGYRIGVWQWELEHFPPQASLAFSLVDEIWTISSFCQTALSAATSKPVHVLPLPVKAYPTDGVGRKGFGLRDDAFVFMTAFDGASFIARKNPLGVIEAFQRAFGKDDPAMLVVKAMNTRGDSLWRECLNRAAADERIRVIDDVFTPARLSSLINAADCVVSLHRAEGFGRVMADAFVNCKPVVASQYSGCMDFLSEDNAYLVPGHLVDIQPGDYPFHADGKWFSPDVGNAASRMREVYEDRSLADIKARRGYDLMASRYSIEAASAFIKQRLFSVIGY